MKRFLFLCLASMMMVACTDDGGANSGGGNSGNGGGNSGGTPLPQASLTVSATSADFATEGGEVNITINSSAAWTASLVNNRADDWCMIDPSSGSAGSSTLTIATTANDTPDDRTASVIIKSGELSKTIAVSQKQKDALTVTSSKFEVEAEGGEIEIEVKANIDFEYTIDESAKEWLTYQSTRAMKTSTLVFAVAQNDEVGKREGKITIKSGEFSEEITVYQAGDEPTIVISQYEYTVSSDGETIAVEVTSNVDVAVELPTDVDWIKESTTRATSTNTYYFDILLNEEYDQREATIKFTNKANGLSESVKVVQAQKDAIVIAEDSYTVSGNGEEIEIEVGHNIEFDFTIDVDWLTQKQTRALETSNLVFVAAENDTDAERRGSITFTSKDGAISQVISVVQGTATFELYYTSYNGKIVTPNEEYWGNANIVSNTYENGIGVITFDRRITSIEKEAFKYCSTLKSIEIPNGVINIKEYAFSKCDGLQSITIPNSVTLIGNAAFMDCGKLSNITLPNSITYIGESAFSGCHSITNITIPNNLTSIGCNVFRECDNLTSITIPNSVTYIEAQAFAECYGLTNVTIPDSVTTIGVCAFRNCSSLTSITIPDSVTTIKEQAFEKCSSLTSITIPESVTTIGVGVFLGCNNIAAFYGKYASPDNKCLIINNELFAFAPYNVTSYIIPDNITSIGNRAFADCNSLKSVTIHNNITSIEAYAFSGCSSLTHITIPDSVYYIGDGAFGSCKSLTSVTIPDNVLLIEEYTFSQCVNLQDIIIGKGVTSIGSYAFSRCSSLQCVTISESVTLIGSEAFERCSSLKEVYVKNPTPPTLNSSVFFWSSYLKIYVPKESVNAYKAANYWRDYADDIEGYDF